MGSISTTDARGLFTKMLVDAYKEKTSPKSFLRSFFQVKESATKEISIEVQRGFEKVAVDVERGTEGNRNSFSKSTEKIIIPPYYREFFDATQLDLYDRLFGSSEIDSAVFTAFLDSVAEKLGLLTDKIERAYELQCAQVFESGIVQLNGGGNINFKRKAASLVDGTASAWTGSVNPYDHLEAGCKFIREVGKSQGAIVNAIFGSSALSAFLNNTTVKERADIKSFSLDAIAMPQRNSVGASLHGEVAVGAYTVRIWSYPEVYTNAAGENVSYVNPKKITMVPETPRFTLSYAAVPQLLSTGSAPKKGAFLISDYIDERNSTHIYDVKSAGVAIPVAVDQIYTRQVIA